MSGVLMKRENLNTNTHTTIHTHGEHHVEIRAENPRDASTS